MTNLSGGRESDSEAPVSEFTEPHPKGSVENAAWNIVGVLTAIAISFITAPLLIYNLGTSKYGMFLLIGSFTGLLSIMNFGLGEATVRYVAAYHGDSDFAGVNRIFASTLSFYGVLAVVVFVVVFATAPMIATVLDSNVQADQFEMFVWVIRLAALAFGIRIIGSTYGMIAPALQRFDITSKINIVGNALKTAGYVAFAIAGYDLIWLFAWDVVLETGFAFVSVMVARCLLPGLGLLPSFSFHGLRETIGYSAFAFLTWAFHTMHREAGKLLMGRFLGAAHVAYLGTPDNLAQRLHGVVVAGTETLVPRFSAERDPKSRESLYWNALWFASALSLILLVPFIVLVPDFLRLWISPEFGQEGGMAGRLLAVFLISQGAFAPVASYYRGIGKPWYVTVWIVASLSITVAAGLRLIPVYGVVGAAYAYLAGSVSPFLAVVIGGFYAFGSSAARKLGRSIVLPYFAGLVICLVGLFIRSRLGELGWFGLVGFGSALLLTSLGVLVGADLFLGGDDPPSKRLIGKLSGHRSVKAILVRLQAIRTS